jgi:C-terminal processing protease CtpA/Prc
MAFAALPGHAQMPNTLSPADKVYGLSKFWSEVNFNFVYLNRIDRKMWDSTYRALIPQVEQTPDDYAYYRLLQKFCALLHDGHTGVWFPPEVGRKIIQNMYGDYLISLTNVGGQAVVQTTLKSKLKEVPLGSVVTEVEGIPVDRYVRDSVYPYISSSTDYVRQDVAMHWLLAGPAGVTHRVMFKRPDGSTIELTLTHARSNVQPDDIVTAVKPGSGELLELKWYKGDIAYLALNSFGDPKIDTLFLEKLPELARAKGLIIDLRNNGGGSTDIGTNILQYLTRDPFIAYSANQSRVYYPYRRAQGQWVETGDTAGNALRTQEWLMAHDYAVFNDRSGGSSPNRAGAQRIVVPTVLLVSHNTASAAEDFLVSAYRQKHMIRMGQNSYGSTGQPLQLDMPGGGGARICTKMDTYPDGTEFVGVGIKPDIPVEMTVQDYIDGKDPVLERALAYLTKDVAITH